MAITSVIHSAQTASHFQQIAELATLIWTEHYTPIIGPAQVAYMLSKFQSVAAIKNQIKEGHEYFIIYHDDAPAGYFSYCKKKESLFLSKIYVLLSIRGMGIGKACISIIEQKAIELECHSISLTVNKNNTGSIKAYEKMGFENKGSLFQYIGNGFAMDDYIMEKQIRI